VVFKLRKSMSRDYQLKDTIAAIATPPGEGGVAIIRISGADAILVGSRVFAGPVENYATHTAHYGRIVDAAGAAIDDALLLVMRDSRSFTGEPTVELQCHGGVLIARRVLERVVEAGARLARPGEFTYRAYLNGKLDLAQAEAVQALIAAKSDKALDAAHQQLQGRLSEQIRSFQTRLIEIAAILEAWVDFPEEGLEFTSFPELLHDLGKIKSEMAALAASFHQGRILREGISLCLAGTPNVGKSSLMNALLDVERAIVTAIPGTTRDFLEEPLRLGGLHFRLIDTAGVRSSDDPIEQEGIRRSSQAMEGADVVLLILDASRPLGADDHLLLKGASKERTLIVWNKIDLAEPEGGVGFPHEVTISATTRLGLDELRSAIEGLACRQSGSSREEVVLTHARHKEALDLAIAACERLEEGLRGALSPEFLCLEVRDGLTALGGIIGQDVTEEILSAIFARFCLGK
jgi:tRNA modification GTPase